jgi:hypothetical protein
LSCDMTAAPIPSCPPSASPPPSSSGSMSPEPSSDSVVPSGLLRVLAEALDGGEDLVGRPVQRSDRGPALLESMTARMSRSSAWVERWMPGRMCSSVIRRRNVRPS